MAVSKLPAILQLRQTCGACPEQYDVYMGGVEVGYLRLRHGRFRAECHDAVVYATDESAGEGQFTDEERPYFLRKACEAILIELGLGLPPALFEVEPPPHVAEAE